MRCTITLGCRPEASLHSVAGKFLDDLEVESEEVRKAVVEFMPASFSSVGATARKYLGEERRWVQGWLPVTAGRQNTVRSCGEGWQCLQTRCRSGQRQRSG